MAGPLLLPPAPAGERPAPRPPAAAPALGGRRHREEVQALRALAVTLVIAFHAWPAVVPGGFAGVDVFFAVSGLLITGGLLRELRSRGTVSLAGFWARRARRLLPAALLVIGACTVASLVLLPEHRWERALRELAASVLYVQNWQLAGTAVDYFGAQAEPSPVQHLWSLAVEEQVYLAWPLVLLALRRRPLLAVGAVTALSFSWGLWHTATEPAVAYFATPARAWELGAGALLAFAVGAPRAGARARAAVTWAGLAAIVAAALAFDERTPWPGVAAAVPVLGALAVMWARAPGRLLALRPVQWLGDVSYGAYLWHWPLLVLLDVPPLAAVVLTLLLAGATKRWVEDPLRHGALAHRRPRATFAWAAAGMALALGLVGGGALLLHERLAVAEAQVRTTLAERPRCFGAAARDPRRPCPAPAVPRGVVPSPAAAARTPNAPCRIVERGARLRVCAFGAERGPVVALVGDSHAAHWRAALDPVAEAEGWRGVSLTYTGCPLSAAPRDVRGTGRARCEQWREEVHAWLDAHPEAGAVLLTALAGGSGVVTRRGEDPFEAAVDGYARAWKRLAGRRLVVLRDTPKAGRGTAACVQEAVEAGRPPGEACAIPRERALDPDPMAAAAEREGVPVVDLTDRFCDEDRCFPVVGGALVHRDQDHLTPTFAATLAPALREALTGNR